jgi:hypothetical protein
MGKVFPAQVFPGIDEANAFCETHPDYGVIAASHDDRIVYVAYLYSITVPSKELVDLLKELNDCG